MSRLLGRLWFEGGSSTTPLRAKTAQVGGPDQKGLSPQIVTR